MSHLPLDARAILEYLNELGYRNITAAQLKEFMKDLRKLIKYEESLGVNVNHGDYFENLYRKTTASYRAKVDLEMQDNGPRRDADRENILKRKSSVAVDRTLEKQSGRVLRDQKQQQPQKQQPPQKRQEHIPGHSKKMTSTLRTDAKPSAEPHTARASRATKKSSNPMWIRPRSKTPHHSRMDPVQLYQYYSNEWNKFKDNLPGESNRSELRWQIRQKLLGEP